MEPILFGLRSLRFPSLALMRKQIELRDSGSAKVATLCVLVSIHFG